MHGFNPDPGDLSALTVTQTVQCPYCGEPIELVVDLSVGGQTYVEDCHVCCRPIVVSYISDGTTLDDIGVSAENE